MLVKEFDRYRHNPDDVKELLAMAVGNPTPEKLRLNEFYTADYHTLFTAMDEGRIIGVIGIDTTNKPHGVITHIAVLPDRRNQGTGSRLISHAAKLLGLADIEAETDQNAVDFYHACNFKITEIESRYPLVRRFRCFKSVIE